MSKEAAAVVATIPTDRQHDVSILSSVKCPMSPLCCRPASTTYIAPPTDLKRQ
jgi:hypothetical protein